MSANFQHKFEGSVPSLKSHDLITQYHPEAVILIDCRTKAEQNVSMIRGAIPIHDSMNLLKLGNDNKPIVTYCTLGFRSGLEAERLRDVLGADRVIFNLDGILAYTHALEKRPDDAPPLVDPSTSKVTKEVHTFSHHWDCAAEGYASKQFSAVAITLRLGQVVARTVVRKIQHAGHHLSCIG
jgi:rhodanese-related sulfurtransferase